MTVSQPAVTAYLKNPLRYVTVSNVELTKLIKTTIEALRTQQRSEESLANTFLMTVLLNIMRDKFKRS